MVRALSDMDADQEITISYCAPGWYPFATRQEKTCKWDFTCQCELWELDREDDYSARSSIIQAQSVHRPELGQVMGFPNRAEDDQISGREGVREALEAIEKTYAPHRALIPELATLSMLSNRGNQTMEVMTLFIIDDHPAYMG